MRHKCIQECKNGDEEMQKENMEINAKVK